MIFSITTFTLIHTLISLVAIVAGLVVVGGLIAGRGPEPVTQALRLRNR
jgi:hypothetical protein